jgi:isorenieratene synthase
MMFHFYFMGNPEGLIFDVIRSPTSTALWQPFAAYLRSRGAQVETGCTAARVRQREQGGFVVERVADGTDQDKSGAIACDALVLALDVTGLRALFANSPELEAPLLRQQVACLAITRPFAVWRLWLDRRLAKERAAFAGTTGLGLLDNVSLYERFQDESAAWAQAHGGSVVELHAYALPDPIDEVALRADLLAGLHAFYPEARDARILDQHFSIRADCPAFAPGTYPNRPEPETELAGLTLAGDFTRLPFPCALMERAAASGLLAANTLLAGAKLPPEPVHSVASRGVFAPGVFSGMFARVHRPRARHTTESR